MTTDILVKAVATGNPKKIAAAQRKIEAAEARVQREAVRKRRLVEAEIALDRERRAAEKVKARERADVAEAKLREAGEPHAIIVYGGREYLIDLSQTEPVAAGTAAESVRRIVFQVKQAWHEQIVGTRNRGEVVPARDFWPQIQTSLDGVAQAMKLGLVAARNVEPKS